MYCKGKYYWIAFFVAIGFVLGFNQQLIAQSTWSENTKVGLAAKAYGDSIVVRVMPTDWQLWYELMKGGMKITRYEMAPNGGDLLTSSAVELTTNEQHFGVLTNTVVAEDVSARLFPSVDIQRMSIIEKAQIVNTYLEGVSEEQEDSSTNLGLGLLAMLLSTAEEGISSEEFKQSQNFLYFISQMYANHDIIIAYLLGTRFVDYTAEEGKTYLYEFESVDHPEQLSYEVSIKNQLIENPPVRDVFSMEDDGKITLAISNVINGYAGYWIERKGENGSFEMLTEFPYTKASTEGGYPQSIIKVNADDGWKEIQVKDYIFYEDSISNYQAMTYRIQGQTIFGEKSEPLLIETMAIDLTPPVSAFITTAELVEKQAYLAWDFGADINVEEVTGFKILVSEDLNGVYEEVSGLGILGPNTRDVLIPGELDAERFYYYAIEILDENENSSISPARYLNVPDEDPPAMPISAEVSFDTTGVMTLTWAENTERDLSGYRVFFSYEEDDDQYMMMSQHLEKEAIYRDTINLKGTLYDTLYYKISAEDISGNLSEKMLVAVPIPDMVPPVPPVLANPVINKDSIVVSWINSSSEDVVMQRLLRRVDGDTIWETLAEITDLSTASFVDLTAEVEVLYQYTMIAIDEVDLTSEYAYPFHGRRFFDDELVSVNNFNADFNEDEAQVDLQWQFQRPEIKLLEGVPHYFHLYKSIGDAPPVLYKRLNGDDLSFTDEDVPLKKEINYAIKVVFENGKRSNLTAAPVVSTQ